MFELATGTRFAVGLAQEGPLVVVAVVVVNVVTAVVFVDVILIVVVVNVVVDVVVVVDDDLVEVAIVFIRVVVLELVDNEDDLLVDVLDRRVVTDFEVDVVLEVVLLPRRTVVDEEVDDFRASMMHVQPRLTCIALRFSNGESSRILKRLAN